jgi:MbtH protein
MSFDDDAAQFKTLINDEGQYSLWPLHREVPAGWREDGVTGPRETCLAHIDEVWTDMRPLTLRNAAAGLV